jgi:hypothetical protein
MEIESVPFGRHPGLNLPFGHVANPNLIWNVSKFCLDIRVRSTQKVSMLRWVSNNLDFSASQGGTRVEQSVRRLLSQIVTGVHHLCGALARCITLGSYQVPPGVWGLESVFHSRPTNASVGSLPAVPAAAGVDAEEVGNSAVSANLAAKLPAGATDNDFRAAQEKIVNSPEPFLHSPHIEFAPQEEADMLVRLGRQMNETEIFGDPEGTQRMVDEYVEYLAGVDDASGLDVVKGCVTCAIEYIRQSGGENAVLLWRGYLLGFMPKNVSYFRYVMLINDMIMSPEERQRAHDRLEAYNAFEASKPNPRVTVVSEGSPTSLAQEVAPLPALTCDKSLWQSAKDWVTSHCWVA